MAKFIKGNIVIMPFPFSNLTNTKRRPALILANLESKDLILCQITSQSIFDNYAISLSDQDFEFGSLYQQSNIRPNRIFTAEKSIILYEVGKVKETKMKEVTSKLIEILQK